MVERRYKGPIAQHGLEQVALNHKVEGSNPSGLIQKFLD